jgi:type I restriction enzyme S subunit
VEFAERTPLDRLMPLGESLGTLSDVLIEPPRNGWSPRCDGTCDGTAVLSLSAVTGFQYNPTAFKRTSEQPDPNAHYWLRRGDLLITRSNTPELVGHAAVYSGTPSPCIYSDLMMRLRPAPDRADVAFVHLWLQTSLVRSFIRENATGTSPTMKKISQGEVSAIPFPSRLSLTRQRELVACASRSREIIERALAVAGAQRVELDALLPAVLHGAFAGAL